MKTKNNLAISTLIAVTIAFSILVAFSATASAATTWYVDDDCGTTQDGTTDYPYCTIQTAIGAAVDGDTIEVAAGTYTENVAVNKQVTLLGANYGVGPDEVRGSESVIEGMVTITADGATVNGFKLTSSYIAAGYTSAQNVDISYNILENVVATWGAIHLHGNHQCDGAYVGYNTISGAVGDGIWTVGNDDVTIEYNHILSSSGFASIQALNHVGTGIVIHANTITNSGGKGINYWAEDGGVITDNVITNSNYEAIYTDAQATISGNQISGGDMYGILVVAWTSGTAAGSTVSGNTISNTNWEGIQSDVPVIITNNDISGGYNGIQLSNAASGSVIDGNNIHDNRYWGLSILDSITDVIVENNQLSNNPYCGVTVWGDGEGSGIHINCNEITGNGIYGVESKRTTSNVDAECNWWGDDSGPSGEGPGTGDTVSINVDFNPWLLTDTSSLVYTGAPQPMTAVVLEATLSDSTSTGISGVDVDFYLDGEDVGSATTNADGVANLEIGPKDVGVYEVSASVCDLESDPALLAIYDPDGGFVTGGGWINSPVGAYIPDPSLTGKATFGFVSKYKKGAVTPTGVTEFQFKAGDLNFHSDSYDWLVIAGHKAMYKGTGTINGDGDYGFMLSAIDEKLTPSTAVDMFRIKIWNKDNGDAVVYDNQLEADEDADPTTEIAGGQIVIHKAK